MNSSVYQATAAFIAQIWRLFNSWYIPGTNVTPAGLALLSLAIVTIIRFSRRLIMIPQDSAGEKGSKGEK